MKTAIAFFIIALMLALAACDGSAGEPPAPQPHGANELDKMISQMETATVISRDLADSQARATTRADATRQHLVLQQQQTRIAGEAIQTQTVFAINVVATASARTATASRAAEEARATATAQSIHATATREAAFATATANTQNAIATATRDAVIVAQTRESASKTATSDAANAKQTQVAANAIQTRTSEETQTLAAKQSWERMTESVRSITSVIGVALVIVGGLLVVGFLALMFSRALDLKLRTGRGANGEPFITRETSDGRLQIFLPMRSPGAMYEINPPARIASGVETGAVDADVTKRDQAVSLMLSASARNRGDDIAGALDDDAPDDEANMPPAPGNLEILRAFEPRALELADAPRRALPIGTTANGAPLWIPFNEVTHTLVGGPSGMGKTNLMHGWIQALQRCDVDVALYDGKDGLEFGRYAAMPRTTILQDDLAIFLGDALTEMKRRFVVLSATGETNINDYNRDRDTDDRMPHRAIVIDELYDALRQDAVGGVLETLAAKARATGIHLIMATQLPDAGSVPKHLRINALLRVAFACPAHTNSTAILGYAGAEKIEKTPGRLLVFWSGQLIEAQAFKAELPSALPAPGNAKQIGAGPSNRPFDDETHQIVEWAVQNGAGWFVVTRIADALGIRDGRVSRAARHLEQMGLVSPVVRDESGQPIGRQISQKLSQMIAA